jgi:L-fuconolactonase
MIVDAHHHFLAPATFTYPWIDGNSPIARDYAPPDLEPVLQNSGIDRTVLVQALDDRAETIWMLGIASRTPWIAGVVGFTPGVYEAAGKEHEAASPAS